jgi:glucosamine-6-phosphate deaminase
MKILKFATYEEMSAAAADIIAKQISIKKDSVIGLATGSTPVGMYKKLAEMNQAGIIDFASVKTVNLDEYYPIDPENRQSYRYFMNDNLFNHINIDKANTYVPNGAAENADEACETYEKIIKSLGGIDIQVLGIGQNGHIGFNEPEDNLYLYTHKTGLTENTIQANSRFFSEDEVMPNAALTMGMGTIFGAKKIIMLINGKNKREAFEKLLNDRITTDCPATLLKLHPNVTVLCDSEAYGE